jgi:hypothetical protein
MPAVVPANVQSPARAARRFFERRTSVTIRARGSPNTPLTRSSTRKPVKRYVSDRRRRVNDLAIERRRQFQSLLESQETQQPCGLQADQHAFLTHTTSRRPDFLERALTKAGLLSAKP